MFKRVLGCMAAVAVLAMLAGNVQATSYGTMQVALSEAMGLNMGQHTPYDSGVYTGFTGAMNMTVVTNSTSPYIAGPFDPYAFCIETQTVGASSNLLWNVISLDCAPIPLGPGPSGAPMGVTKANLMKELWFKHFDEVVNNVTAAAFAEALYEIEFEDLANGLHIATGNYYGTAGSAGANGTAALTQAQTWLDTLTSDGSGPKAELYALSRSNSQDFVFGLSGGGGQIPEPVTMLGLFLGLGGIGAYIRKRRMA